MEMIVDKGEAVGYYIGIDKAPVVLRSSREKAVQNAGDVSGQRRFDNRRSRVKQVINRGKRMEQPLCIVRGQYISGMNRNFPEIFPRQRSVKVEPDRFPRVGMSILMRLVAVQKYKISGACLTGVSVCDDVAFPF